MSNTFNFDIVNSILDLHICNESSVIAILQDIQAHYHYLPKEVFPYLAVRLNTKEASIYSVATFYENFSLDPKGKYIIKICDGTACHVRKSIPVLDRFRQELGLSEDKVTTDDLMFTVETVSCLGACGLAPAITVNEKVNPAMTADKASQLIKDILIKEGKINA